MQRVTAFRRHLSDSFGGVVSVSARILGIISSTRTIRVDYVFWFFSYALCAMVICGYLSLMSSATQSEQVAVFAGTMLHVVVIILCLVGAESIVESFGHAPRLRL